MMIQIPQNIQADSLVVEGSLEARLPTIWTDAKQQPGKSSGMEKARREKMRDGEDQKGRKPEERRCRCAKKIENSRNIVCFPLICASKGSQSRLAEAAAAEPAGQMRDERLHAVDA